MAVGVMADSRGRSGSGYFCLSAMASPLIGLIVVLVNKDLAAEEVRQRERNEDHERHLTSIKSVAPSGIRSSGAAAFQNSTVEDVAQVRCPECRELVRADARKCKHCGSPLVPKMIAVDLESGASSAVRTTASVPVLPVVVPLRASAVALGQIARGE